MFVAAISKRPRSVPFLRNISYKNVCSLYKIVWQDLIWDFISPVVCAFNFLL